MRVQVSPRAQILGNHLTFSFFLHIFHYKFMAKRILLYILFVLFISGIVLADVIKAGSVLASSDGNNVTIRWVTENETNVIGFEVLRSTSYAGGFVTIAYVDPKGSSVYEFVDNSAFMRTTTIYYYRIKVKYSNGESYFPALNEAPITVYHNVSGVRRTWGSIKAMFR